MLRDAGAGKFDCLLFDDITRFGRANDRAGRAGPAQEAPGQDLHRHQRVRPGRPREQVLPHHGRGPRRDVRGDAGRKSIQGKVKRAKAGMPSSGAKPWGRSYDKFTGRWSKDEDKEQRLIEAAEDF